MSEGDMAASPETGETEAKPKNEAVAWNETAKTAEKAAKKITAAAKTAKTKAEAWAKAETAWGTLSEAAVDAANPAQVAARTKAAKAAMSAQRRPRRHGRRRQRWKRLGQTPNESGAGRKAGRYCHKGGEPGFRQGRQVCEDGRRDWKKAETREGAAIKMAEQAEKQD